MKLSLGQLFAAALASVSAVVAIGFVLFLRSGRESALATANVAHEVVATQVHHAIVDELGRARKAADRIERGAHAGAISVGDETALEGALFVEMLGDEHLSEVTLTSPKLQASVFRTPDGRLITRLARADGASFVAFTRTRAVNGTLLSAPLVSSGPAADPTKHLTFTTLLEERNRTRSVWSDLSYAEHDKELPPEQRRVVLTVQRRVDDATGALVGVVRVGLSTRTVDEVPKVIARERDKPYTIAIFSFSTDDPPQAALVARPDPNDRIVLRGDDLRVVAAHPPPAIAALMQSPLFAGLDPDSPSRQGTFEVAGESYVAVMREIHSQDVGGTSGWFVAVLGPESNYTKEVKEQARALATVSGVTLLVILAIGAIAVRGIRRGLDRAVQATARMRAFDFAAGVGSSRLREIDELVSGLERAKTVVRAMGKYIPMDLVRDLYATNQEPMLGGELVDISIMFTDIEGFTTLAEKLPPDKLAQALGEYLAAMTRAITTCDGTIDKYIGDAVMALWNAPAAVTDHATKACRAALAAMKTAEALFASPIWKDLPPLVTRFGIHKAKVMVGHFGAPSRLSYTALGDGVNLAARLEPLCKQYGIVALVSEDVVADAASSFVFRRIDRVAVKGKSKCIDVYELLGAVGTDIPSLARARTYEAAFDLYLARNFAGAAALLTPQASADPPSAVLLERCEALSESPPPADWTGVFLATSK